MLIELKRRFMAYAQTVQPGDPAIQATLQLKIDHTARVCQEIITLGQQLELPAPLLTLAEITAVFHDVGRFEQFATYRTFADRLSVDHAALGVTILRQRALLHGLNPALYDLIYRVIAYHNRKAVPPDESDLCLFLTKLLRDADKLDIWHVALEAYAMPPAQRNTDIWLGLPDRPELSAAACADLLARRMVDIRHLRTLNDFKLLQLGWMYDLNFHATFQALRDRRYVERLCATLPATAVMQNIVVTLADYQQQRAQEAQLKIPVDFPTTIFTMESHEKCRSSSLTVVSEETRSV